MVYIVAVSGGSGSGKTTLAKNLKEKLSDCDIIYQDSYYLDQSEKFDGDGGSVNFDHPDALEFNLLAEHLKLIKQSEPVDIPLYDFTTHRRKEEVFQLKPKKVVIVDGILIFSQPQLLPLFDYTIFIDVPEEVRFQRRLFRDVKERGRTEEGVRTQFFSQVKPMHDKFVEPGKETADLCLKFGQRLDEMTDEVLAQLGDALRSHL